MPQQLPPRGKTWPTFDVNATTFHPARDHHGLEANRHCTYFSSAVEAVILSVARQCRKPHSETIKFNGDPLTYNKFIRQFLNIQII